MARIDLERAEALLGTARHSLERGDFAGVAGLAYQAFESAVSYLLGEVNGRDPGTHMGRLRRAKELIRDTRDEVNLIYAMRNIDFYSNVETGGPKLVLTEDETRRALSIAEDFISEIKALLQKGE